MMTFAFIPVAKIIYSAVISLLNSKKAVRIQQFTDGATILLRKHYHTGLNQIKYYNFVKNLHNFSVLIFLNLNLIPSIKVSDNFDLLQESIKDTINTLRLYTMCED